jgi:hypothetical protein
MKTILAYDMNAKTIQDRRWETTEATPGMSLREYTPAARPGCRV